MSKQPGLILPEPIPRPIEVVNGLGILTESEEQPIRTYTELFRNECSLGDSLSEVYDRTDSDGITIVSAGCSIGAEIDSLVALHNNAQRSGRLAVFGYDRNPAVIMAAEAASYIAKSQPTTQDGQALNAFGFDCEPVITETITAHGKQYGFGLQIDSRGIREGHEVKFTVGDISDTTIVPGADLIMANNVLYYLEPDLATRTIRNLAESLGPTGVLSVGGAPPKYYWLEMGRPVLSGGGGDYRKEKSMGRWLRGIKNVLRDEFELVPIRQKRGAEATMFARA